jgi:antitoxin CptB
MMNEAEQLAALRRRRIVWRATHRGTKEADMLVGGFCDRYLDAMDEAEMRWFEALLDEQDVDIMAWAFGKADVPTEFDGTMMERMKRLDYIRLVPR